MGRTVILGPKPGTLFDTKTMLFVDDHHAQVLELHIGFDQGMGADEDVELTVFELFVDETTILLRGAACEQS